MRKNLFIIIAAGLVILFAGLFYYLVKTHKITPFAAALNATLTLNPATGTHNIGDLFDVNVNLDTGGQAVGGVQVYLSYDPSVLEVQDADSVTSGVQVSPGDIANFDTKLSNVVDSGQGKIDVAYMALNQDAFTGSGKFVSIKFKALAAAANTGLNFDYDGSTLKTNVAEAVSAENILVQPSNGNYTIQSPSPSLPTVDLKVDGKDSATISSGSSIELSWNSTNATSCSSSWGGSKNTSGAETISNVTSSVSFTLTCQGGGGSISDSASVTVQASGGGSTDETSSDENTSEESTTSSDETSTSKVSQTPTSISETMTEVVNTPQISKLPSNIQPEASPTKKQTTIYKNEAMKPWTLWFLYAIIPAFLAGGAIFIYLKRKKVAKKDEII